MYSITLCPIFDYRQKVCARQPKNWEEEDEKIKLWFASVDEATKVDLLRLINKKLIFRRKLLFVLVLLHVLFTNIFSLQFRFFYFVFSRFNEMCKIFRQVCFLFVALYKVHKVAQCNIIIYQAVNLIHKKMEGNERVTLQKKRLNVTQRLSSMLWREKGQACFWFRLWICFSFSSVISNYF